MKRAVIEMRLHYVLMYVKTQNKDLMTKMNKKHVVVTEENVDAMK